MMVGSEVEERRAREQDHTAARFIPDAYMGMHSDPSERVMELISRCWHKRSEGDRRELAQVLLTILAPLNARPTKVTNDLRAQCETAVVEWIGKARQAPPDPHGRMVSRA